MQQIIQSYKNGKIDLADVPYPSCSSSAVIVQNMHSVISIGTEKSMIELGRKSLLGKARSRPDLVKRFMEKAKNEGFFKTFQSAQRRLNDAMPLGYSSAGKVVEVGSGVSSFRPGDLVACIGGGFASHAEYICVPENLCARIPEGVSSDQASFGMLGIIAMHALRCADLKPGERVAVVGLGLLGLILSQLLHAYGFQVIATDLDANKRSLAQDMGLGYCPAPESFVSTCEQVTNGSGVDAVILAVATQSDQPIHEAIKVSRFRGRIVLMGVADTHPHRNDLWEKEVSLIVSKAGGPGIGDPTYELLGIDYPLEYVRWTENRNLEEFLRLLEEQRISLKPLITHTFDFDQALPAYEQLLAGKREPTPVGVLLRYSEDGNREQRIKLKHEASTQSLSTDTICLGLIGAGMFAKTTMLPVLSQNAHLDLHTICTSRGLTGNHVGTEYGFAQACTDVPSMLATPEIQAVMILTQHKDHARFTSQCLEHGKHTFVEKPLCVSHDQLDQIRDAYNQLHDQPVLFVGYNRRFSPMAEKLKAFFAERHAPLVMQYRVNAGFLEPKHWIFSPDNGNGRIIGEACHMVDLMLYLTGSLPVKVGAERVGGGNGYVVPNDNAVVTLRFEDGSVGTITYTGSGDRALSKERLEVFCQGKTGVLTDFRELELYHNGKRKREKLKNADLGYKAEVEHFVEVVKGKEEARLTVEEIFASTRAVLCAHDSLETGESQEIRI